MYVCKYVIMCVYIYMCVCVSPAIYLSICACAFVCVFKWKVNGLDMDLKTQSGLDKNPLSF